MTDPVWPMLLGRFTWDSLPFVRAWHNPTTNELIAAAAGGIVVVGGIAVLVLITVMILSKSSSTSTVPELQAPNLFGHPGTILSQSAFSQLSTDAVILGLLSLVYRQLSVATSLKNGHLPFFGKIILFFYFINHFRFF